MRKKLTKGVENKGDFKDEEVVRVSQLLDMYILEIQRKHKQKP
ncbi:aspartyl-phosphate phosphatase Spo0E family protein [Paenibacillus thiaminolyticus]|nr:aspartyl-phosphate phosphatase Spo0E family protein [Paenibacillus thiaminolyticus]